MAKKSVVSALAAAPAEAEKVTIDINGIPTEIFRPKGQSDEEWARVKEKAREDSAATTIDNTPAQIERGDMTDEEWQKTKELVNRKGDPASSGDYVFLKPQGEGKSAFVYPRKPSMTDEEWAAQVAEHKKHPRYGYTKSEKQGSEEDQALRDRVAEKVIKDPSSREMALSDYDRSVMERMNESDRRKFIQDRMKNKGTPVSEKPSTGTASNESGGGTIGGMIRGAVQKLTSGATPSGAEGGSGTSDIQTKSYSPGEIRQLQRSGAGAIRGMDEAAKQADYAVAEGQDGPQWQKVTDARVNAANAVSDMDGQARASEDTMKLAKADRARIRAEVMGEGESPPDQSLFDSVDGQLGQFKNAVVDAVTGNADVMGSLGSVAGMVAGGMNPQPQSAFPGQADPLDPQAQPPVPLPQQPMPQGGSASMSMKMPGGFRAAEANPEAMKRFVEASDAAKAAGEGFRSESKAQLDHQRQMIEEASQTAMVEQGEMARLSKLAGDAKITSAQENQRFQNAANVTRERARMAAANPVDPNRYWNSKSEGQRAAGLMAAALFGFTGQGLQWLGQVDAAIANDMRAQEGDRSALVNAYGEEARGLGEAGRAALESGATVAEAHLLERNARLEGLKVKLDMLGKNMTQSDQIMRYQQMGNDITQALVRNEAQGAQLAQGAADSKNQVRYQQASLAQQAWAAQLKADAKQQKGEPLPPAIAKRLDESFEAYRSVSSMARLAKNAGAGDRFKRDLKETKVGRFFDGNEEGAKNDLYEQQKVELMKRRAGGALQQHEVDILEPITGGARSGIIDSYPTLEKTAKDFRSSLVQTIRSEAAANRDVSKYVQMLTDMDAESAPTLKTERPVK